ncbi:hypothetical protein ACHAXT_007677 [Thalassiosira profunda]
MPGRQSSLPPQLLLLAALPLFLILLFSASNSHYLASSRERLCELGLVARLFLDDCDESIAVMTEDRGRHSTPHSRRHPLQGAAEGWDASYDVPSYFLLDLSTQENYGVEDREFYGQFKQIRAGLDYDYHGNYSRRRQAFQDRIVEGMLDGTTIRDAANGQICKTPTEPWIVFTAGVMGAGKSHTMKQLASRGLFPLGSYVIVDPDEIRQHFPEYHLYAEQSPKRAGELTHREAGYISEIVTAAAMQNGHNVLVDGSLRDYEWYLQYFRDLRKRYPKLRIAILHVVAPRDKVFERAAHRAETTGRIVPRETLEASLQHVPLSVRKLAPAVDFFAEIDNSTPGEVTLRTEGMAWDDFRDNWAQTCPRLPTSKI